jgi:S-DNA-T family DNA segregation ATPase FtsK/SpoIIIE
MGAEALLGQGDMLYLAPGTGYPTRVHGAFVADEEVHHVVDHLKKAGAPDYVEGVLSGAGLDDDGEGGNGDGESGGGDAEADPLYDQAVEIVLKNRRASISLVQRHLRIGYNRSARLIEAMEKAGLVSAMDGRGGREVIARKEEN